MDLGKENNRISIIGEFSNRILEQEFSNDYMARNIKYLRPIVLIFGLVNMLFIIPDYLFSIERAAFFNMLEVRIVLFLLISIFFFSINKFKTFKPLSYWITGYEILGSISFIIILGQYNRPNFLIQAFGVIVLISIIFIVPNKWINMLTASVFVSSVFFVFSKYYLIEIPISDYSAGVVYIILVLILSSMGAFRSNYYNRKQFINSKELIKLSITDQLTGIFNRTKCDAELERWLNYSQRYEEPLAIILFDIDNFKKINDEFGHLTGDKVLMEVARVVRSNIRKCDVFARWGGDEFILLLPNTDEQKALHLAERLKSTIAIQQFETFDKVTCSFGLAMAKPDENADCLLNRTDQTLYIAKQQGKNIVAIYQDYLILE